MAAITRTMLISIIEASGKTQKQFAGKIGVKEGSLSKWLAGTRRPAPQCQERIRKEFKSEIAKLYK